MARRRRRPRTVRRHSWPHTAPGQWPLVIMAGVLLPSSASGHALERQHKPLVARASAGKLVPFRELAVREPEDKVPPEGNVHQQQRRRMSRY